MSYLYEGVEEGFIAQVSKWSGTWIELARIFTAMPSRRQQEALCLMAKALAEASIRSVAGDEATSSPNGASDECELQPAVALCGAVWHV